MIDPWAGIASLLATVIEKYGAKILQEEMQAAQAVSDTNQDELRQQSQSAISDY